MEDLKLVLVGMDPKDGIARVMVALPKPGVQTVYLVASPEPEPDITDALKGLPKLSPLEYRPEKKEPAHRPSANFHQRRIPPPASAARRRPQFQAKRGLR